MQTEQVEDCLSMHLMTDYFFAVSLTEVDKVYPAFFIASHEEVAKLE